MIRVNRHLVAGALLTGAVVMSIAPAQAEVPLATDTSATPQAIVDSGSADFLTSGSASILGRMLGCPTIWNPTAPPC